MNTKEILQGIKDWAAPKVIFDISAAHNNTKYTDISDALGTNGGNIPQEYRKGGMSVKFVQTSDNKYVQYFLTKNEWSASESDWEKMNLEEEVGQLKQDINGIDYSLYQGTIRPDNGWFIPDVTTSIRTSYLNGKLHITTKSGYYMNRICEYNPTTNAFIQTLLSDNFNRITEYTYDDTNAICIVFSKGDGLGTITPEENPIDHLFVLNSLLAQVNKNKEDIQAVEQQISQTDTEFDQLQDIIFGPIYRGIVLGSYFSNSDGEPSYYGMFARTGKIDITTIDKLVFVENELNYYILTFFAWDANGNYLGYHNIGGNSVTREYMAGLEPNAAMVGFNFYCANPVMLTPENTADWLFYAPETGVLQRLDNLEFEQETKSNSIELSFEENAVSTIRSPFNEDYDIIANVNIKRNDSEHRNNPVFNYNGVALINKNTQQSTMVHSCSDDIAPALYNGTYIGGNHGDSDVCVITANGHGKTYVDIGSQWTDGTNQCTIVGIVNANQLLVLGENTAQYPIFRFNKTMFASGVTLTRVSGATHTGNIAITAVSSTQWWPATSVAAVSVFADGKEITTNGKYNFNHLNICEQYDVYNPASVLEKIQAGVGTFTSNPAPNQFPTADKVVRHSIVYGFDGADKWTVSVDFIAYQDIEINYYGFTQQAVLDGSNIKMYIPKTLPIVAGGATFDFRSLIAYNSLSEAINLTGSYWENPNLPPDRWLQTSENIALHSGYLFDYGVGGENRKDNISNSFYLYTSRKCYPHGIDSKVTVHAGDVLSSVVWRTYLDLANINTNGILSQNAVEYKNGCYLYADFTAIGMYQIDIPEKFVGKKISVFEKSANVEVLAQLSNTKILIKVNSASPLYGYAVLKIS